MPVTKFYDGAYFTAASYGIDERIMLRLAQDEEFLTSAYIVGFVWIFGLFFPQHNPRSMSRYDGDAAASAGLSLTDMDSVKFTKNYASELVTSAVYPLTSIQTYYRETTCVVKYLNARLNALRTECGRSPLTTDELWQRIEAYQRGECTDADDCSLLKRLTDMIPP